MRLLPLVLLTGLAIVLVGAARGDSAPLLPCSDPRGCPDLLVDEALLANSWFTDLQSFSAKDCAVQEGLVGASGVRRLLRLSTGVVNGGRGAFHLGNLYTLGQTTPQLAEPDLCHRHMHLKNFSAYRLWTPEQYQQWQRVQRGDKRSSDELLAAHPELSPLTGHKQGWCPTDLQLYVRAKGEWVFASIDDPRWSTQVYAAPACDPTQAFDWDISGISPSWGDIYSASIVGQWVDISGVPSGTYILEVEVNPSLFIEEASYRNNVAAAEVIIE